MSEQSVQTAITAMADRLATGRKNWESAFTGGTTLWNTVDGAADQIFENRVKGQTLTDADTALANGAFGNQSAISNVFSTLSQYFTNATTASEPGLGLTGDGFNDYLALRGVRVPDGFAELYYERNGIRLTPDYVFPKGVWAANIADNATAGLHSFGAFVKTTGAWPTSPAGSEGVLDSTKTTGAAVILVSDAGLDGGTFTGTFTCLCQDGTTTKSVTVTGITPSDTQVVLGEQAIGAAGAAAGQKVVPVVATSQFTEGEWVLLVEGSVAEIAEVTTVTASTSLTMTSNLVNAFTSSGKVWPLFLDVTALGSVTAASAGNGDSVELYARPDRAIAL